MECYHIDPSLGYYLAASEELRGAGSSSSSVEEADEQKETLETVVYEQGQLEKDHRLVQLEAAGWPSSHK